MNPNAKVLRAVTAVLVALLPLSTPLLAESPAAASASPRMTTKITIDNFGRVADTYYRGAQPEGHDYADLAALGVKTDIDLTKDGDPAEAAQAERAGLKFVRIPMTTHEPPTTAQIAQFLSIVDDPANQPVYVHCQGGRHRTGVMTAIYRMTDDRWTADRAFAEMKQYKFGADFLHPEFKSFVYHFVAPDARAPRPVFATKIGD